MDTHPGRWCRPGEWRVPRPGRGWRERRGRPRVDSCAMGRSISHSGYSAGRLDRRPRTSWSKRQDRYIWTWVRIWVCGSNEKTRGNWQINDEVVGWPNGWSQQINYRDDPVEQQLQFVRLERTERGSLRKALAEGKVRNWTYSCCRGVEWFVRGPETARWQKPFLCEFFLFDIISWFFNS